MKTVYVPSSGSRGDYLPVIEMFGNADWAVLTGALDPSESIDLICFTGGSDVSPYLYGEENTSSYCDPLRDEFEKEIYDTFVGKVPMVGICRGGQFLNVMNGGKMIQDIPGHSMGYRVVTDLEVHDPKSYTIHEDHHQGMIPNHEGVRPLLWDPRDENYEALYYHKTRCLCFQPHPEWGHDGTRELFFELMKEYLDV